ncbi:MAG: thiamine pyrophosphate-dependent enzyme [Bacillota bacterium]|nr:thiamine pyrophosphate-dependent enzyme [Bacillota bacterium]
MYKEKMPFLFCPGCGNGVLVHLLARAVEELDLWDRVSCVGGIGCSSWIPTYLKVDYLKTLHGRTLPAATGLRVTRPDRKVIVVVGDGDGVGIGGNHLIHAARRNIDLAVVMVNNQIYGMTGGQAGPTTPFGARTTTTPYGNLEPPVDACRLVEAAGGTYVARWTTAHQMQLLKALKKAIMHPGFGFVEVLSPCPVQTGRYVMGSGDPVRLWRWLREHTTVRDGEEGKVRLGEFVELERPELTAQLYELMAARQAAARAAGVRG